MTKHIASNAKVAIVGGGLSGITTAYQLAKRGVDFQLFEARSRFGGRILTLESKRSTARFDLGPSWFWPGQSHIESLIHELGLHRLIYSQYSIGDAIYEPQGAPMQRGVSGISMAGSYRLHGGLSSLINALVEKIAELGFDEHLNLSAQIQKISQDGDQISLLTSSGVIKCDSAVLALPARAALSNIDFVPKADAKRRAELDAVATWMAGHSKVIAEYDQPFWRHEGYSGDVISQIGPMSEIHDASSEPRVGEPQAFALFGFLGIAPKVRRQHSEQLPDLLLQQFTRLFGDQAKTPTNLVIHDWAQEAFTASELDQSIPNHHPINRWSSTSEPGWNGALLWSGSETADDHTNGYLEGAVLAAKQSIKQLII